MKMFHLRGTALSLDIPSVVSLLNEIEQLKGKTACIADMKKVDFLKEIAKVSGTLASNAIGNVYVADEREKPLFAKGGTAKNPQEGWVLGYRNALDLIDEVYATQELDRSFITTLHYYIYKDVSPDFGGKYKDTQNYIQESDGQGGFRTIFVSAAPERVIPLLDNLVYQFNECAKDEKINKLVLIAAFMLDFMCIHPYNHGNGRVSRLLFHFLTKKFGYDIDDYFALPYLMKLHLGEYIDSFKASTEGWYDDENNYEPFVTFILSRIVEGYRKLEYIIMMNSLDMNIRGKVYKTIADSATPITKKVILRVLFPHSKATIEDALNRLLGDGAIRLVNSKYYSIN